MVYSKILRDNSAELTLQTKILKKGRGSNDNKYSNELKKDLAKVIKKMNLRFLNTHESYFNYLSDIFMANLKPVQ